MDKLLMMLGTMLGRSFIVGVFLAICAALAVVWLENKRLNEEVGKEKNLRIEAEQKYRAESDARWRADIERSNGIIERIEKATNNMKRKK